jgi:hypothetical protein
MDDTMMSDNIFDALPTLSGPSKVALADELTHYLAAPVERTRDPLQWWVEKQKLYPCLSRMARDYLCIPGMFVLLGTRCVQSNPSPSATSIDVERLFSKGRLVLSHVRNRLSAGTTRELLCLNNWIGQGLVQLEDVKEAASLPEVLNDCPEEEQDEFGMVL